MFFFHSQKSFGYEFIFFESSNHFTQQISVSNTAMSYRSYSLDGFASEII